MRINSVFDQNQLAHCDGLALLLTGIGLPDDRLHAPDEKLDLKQLWDGIEVFKRFYQTLGGQLRK